MKKHIFLTIPVVIAIVVACKSSEFELEKSVYNADPYYPSLPAYSEWGYNTFGAYYDRELFTYNEKEVPAKVINTAGKTSFILKGGLDQIDYNDAYYSGYNTTYAEMSIAFELPGFLPETYIDLEQLNDTVIDLTNPECHVYATIDTSTFEMQIFNGELQFIRAQQLLVDKKPTKVILSGYFDFKALVDGEPISVSYGRFDVGIGEFNFFNY
jgi:hypothetical protein